MFPHRTGPGRAAWHSWAVLGRGGIPPSAVVACSGAGASGGLADRRASVGPHDLVVGVGGSATRPGGSSLGGCL
eukprot:11208336-Alexandrium_andersonii.AAC.1